MDKSHLPVRSHLIAVASRALDRDALAALSVNNLCNESGITKGGFYHYFRSKDELVAAVIDRCAAGLDLWLQSCTPAAAPRGFGRISSFLDLVMAKIADPDLVDVVIIGAVPDHWRRCSLIRRSLSGYMTVWRTALLADVPVSLSHRDALAEQQCEIFARHVQMLAIGAMTMARIEGDPAGACTLLYQLKEQLNRQASATGSFVQGTQCLASVPARYNQTLPVSGIIW